ncbi:MAG: hypothetical protein ACE14V_15675, partial [bacterium]
MRLNAIQKYSYLLIILVYTAYGNAQVAVSSSSIRDTTALLLLDKYAATQDKLLSFKVKYEESFASEYYDTTPQGMNAKYHRNQISECWYTGDSIRRDNQKFKLRELEWGNIFRSASDYCPKEKASYRNVIYDGKVWLQYFADAKNVIHQKKYTYLSPHPTLINIRTVQFRHLGLLMGYMEGDFEERIDSILRNARSLKLREKPE